MGRALGADVAFFLGRSPLALGSGRGDRLTPLAPLPPLPVLLVRSPEGVGTAWAYDLLARGREGGGGPPATGQPLLRPDCCADWEAIAGVAHNDFEAPIFAVRPDLREVAQALRASLPLLSLMSGSGSTVFAVYRDDAAAERARSHIGPMTGGRSIHLASTLSNFPGLRTL